jgi:hypothetical protein
VGVAFFVHPGRAGFGEDASLPLYGEDHERGDLAD